MTKLITLFVFLLSANAYATVVVQECGSVDYKISQQGNVTKARVVFDFDKECIFYTQGTQDLAKEPTITVSNTDFTVESVVWPKGVQKIELIGDEKYTNTVVKGPFEVIIPATNITKYDAEAVLNISYQVCKAMQCHSESIDIKIVNGKESSNDETVIETQYKKPYGIVIQCIIAFICGFILNFMPCVLPVLGIKIASLSHGNKTAKEIRMASLFTLLGVVSTFLVLGVLSSIIKLPFHDKYDDMIWGHVFQDKFFVLTLLILVAAMIDIHRGKCNIFNHIKQNNFTGLVYHFVNGVISTLLASPCVAPVIGISLVFAAESSIIGGVVVFTFIGLGFGLPYLASYVYPDIYKKIPKNTKIGFWLDRLFNVLLFLTFFWLLYIVALGNGMYIAVFIMLFIFILSNYGWKMKNSISQVILFATLIGLMFALVSISNNNKEIDSKIWHKFSSEKLDKALYDKKVVLVLGTADWCSWCHILEKTVLERERFVSFIQEKDIVMLKADLTDSNDKEANNFYKNQTEFGLPILRVYSNNNPNGRSIILESFAISKVVAEIETEINNSHIIKTS